MLQCEIAHLARADDQDGFVAEGIEDVFGDFDRDAGDRQLAAIHAGDFADSFAHAERILKYRVENRSGRLARRRLDTIP